MVSLLAGLSACRGCVRCNAKFPDRWRGNRLNSGPGYQGCCIIEGNFTAALQPGAVVGITGGADVSLAQVGQVPSFSESLLFKFVGNSPEILAVSLGGERLNIMPLQTNASFTLYGPASVNLPAKLQNCVSLDCTRWDNR
jgi:hypothetical protein